MQSKYQAVVIGTSAGGMAALTTILADLPAYFLLPIMIVQHVHPQQEMDSLISYYRDLCPLPVKEADDKERLQPGSVYFAPPNYHLLVEQEKTLALSVDERVNYCRPAIDVLFESAADVYCPELIGVVLTGANQDGAHGLAEIKRQGGLAIVQDPATAEVPYMPQAAIEAVEADYILPLNQMAQVFITCCCQPERFS